MTKQTTENQSAQATEQPKRLTKAEMLALLQSEDFDREALVEALQQEQVKTVPFRERADLKPHIEAFNNARQKAFQPAIYRKDADALGVAIKGMVQELQSLAEAAGITLQEEEPEA